MGRIFCIFGKSSSGKDTIYKRLLHNKRLHLNRIVPYTTRPIRAGEREGVEYYFTTVEKLQQFADQNKIIECRSYDTVYGPWYYFMVKDAQIVLEKQDYLTIGTLESYEKIRMYFGDEKVVPIYITLQDGERLTRALKREKKQAEPRYEEMCRRFLADAKDFSPERLAEAGIKRTFENLDLRDCLCKISSYILSFRK